MSARKRKHDEKKNWIAVESEFTPSGKIMRAKTAFMFFQQKMFKEKKQSHHEEGISTTETGAMGPFMKEISEKWNLLSAEEKKVFEDQALQAKEEYLEATRERDAEYEEKQRKKREEREADVGDKKRERKIIVESTPKKARVQQEKSEKQIKLKEIRQQQKEARNELKNEQKRQKDNLQKIKAEAASNRLKFLLGQSDIFAHFGHPLDAKTSTKESNLSSVKKRLSEREEDQSMLSEGDKTEINPALIRLTKQPSIIKFGEMRNYQLEGLNWMIQLANRGINGILADEMGLGKTLQTISILAYHKEFVNVNGPHLVLVPKSTLSNWLNEFRRWCPSIRTVKFHGDAKERQRIIEEILRPGHLDSERLFDVVITSYEMAVIEKSSLQKFAWKYLVIDEAHRIKNESSLFSKIVREFETHHRLLLTGTPLQNNLHELWALLNFLLPDVFSSAEQFDEWFNLDIDDEETKKQLITQLHRILRPFMLRRLKSDVEKSLPPKKETLLFVGMSAMQKQLYKNVLLRDLEAITGGASHSSILNVLMQLRKACGHPYLFEGQEDRMLDPMGEHLVQNCGKLVLLDKLLHKLKARGSRVLIFSQMTRILDILEDYCRMRRFQYCRIDGQTSYDDREEAIDSYNVPNSSKFIFLLSTRAGGLGINLYTADVVILYDSDWNPQCDLQAQDRAHRIGQKKVVNVYRLVTENSVEEKIIERAQQKLKLDAMIVQQGRLQEKSKALSKDDMLEMIRFGADTVFRSSQNSEITDADIDAIISQGAARTEEMNKKLQTVDKGDLLNFKMDGFTCQEHDGIDYSNPKERMEEMKRIADAEFAAQMAEGIGKRERRPVTNYNMNSYYQQQLMKPQERKRRKMLPKALRLPKMEDWQFYNRNRIMEIHEIECAEYENTPKISSEKISSEKTSSEKTSSEKTIEKTSSEKTLEKKSDNPIDFLTPDLIKEKQELMEEGFGDWTKANFNLFIKLNARYGRNNIESIANELGKPIEEVKKYSQVFFLRGNELNDWERILRNIEKGESKLLEIQRLTEALDKKIEKYKNPWETLLCSYQGKQGKAYIDEEDRYLLLLTHRHGYGAWDKIKHDICQSERFLFDYYLRSRTSIEIGKRCDALMRLCEKENVEVSQREIREQEIKEQLEVEHKNIKEKIDSTRGAIRTHETVLNSLILEETKLRQENETKHGTKQLIARKSSNSFPSEYISLLADFISKSQESEAGKLAKLFTEQHKELQVTTVLAKILDIAERKGLPNKNNRPTWRLKSTHNDTENSMKTNSLNKPNNNSVVTKEAPSSPTTFRLPSSPWSPSAATVQNLKKKEKPNSSQAWKKLKPLSSELVPKKPRSAYVLYSLSCRAKVKKSLGSSASVTDLMAKLTEMWQNLDDDARFPWLEEAERDIQRYAREMEEYKSKMMCEKKKT